MPDSSRENEKFSTFVQKKLKMRITHMIFGFTTGGAELMLADIAAAQAEAGHEVTILVVNRHYEQELLDKISPKVQVVLVNRPEGSRNPLWLLRYNLMLRRTRPDVVHFHQMHGTQITPHWRGVTFAVTVHDTGVPMRLHTGRTDRLFAISEAVQTDLRTRLGLESTVVTNGIVCSSIAIPENGTAQAPAAGEPLQLVSVARLLHEKKGQDIALRALAEVTAAGLDAHLTLIGEGPSEAYLRQLVGELGVDSRVRFAGNLSRTEIYSTLKDYHMFLLPSRYEGFGLTVAEAMAAKIPVIVSDVEGPMDIIGQGLFGTPFRCGDHHALAGAIKAVAADYQRHASIAAKEAYEHVTRSFDIARTAAEYVAAYRP